MAKSEIAAHGQAVPRRFEHWPRSKFHQGQYGRMFRELPPADTLPSKKAYQDLLDGVRADQSDAIRADAIGAGAQASGIFSGYTYFGQFIAHDISFNPISDLTRRRDPESLDSFRSPRLDLDSLYGRGPKDSPYLYDPPDKDNCVGRLAVGWGMGRGEEDLPRVDNDAATALIGDPRNDENTMISQLHLAFIKLHNRFYDDTDRDFQLAQRLTNWHYQWVVLNDYLRRVCDPEVLDEIWPQQKRQDGLKPELRWYQWKYEPYIPLEFSGAAFRFGHSMVRDAYRLNFAHEDPIPVFGRSSLGNLRGFRRLPPTWTVQWNHFLKFDDQAAADPLLPQQTGLIDLSLSPSLGNLPREVLASIPDEEAGDVETNLAAINIQRGYMFDLPSGQAVARAMRLEPLKTVYQGEDPLWVYILREAKEQQKGKRLGKVGSTIVAETIFGLIAGDPLSYLTIEPKWKPADLTGKWSPTSPQKEDFDLSDLIRAARMPITQADLERKRGFQSEYDPRAALTEEMRRAGQEVQAEQA